MLTNRQIKVHLQNPDPPHQQAMCRPPDDSSGPGSSWGCGAGHACRRSGSRQVCMASFDCVFLGPARDMLYCSERSVRAWGSARQSSICHRDSSSKAIDHFPYHLSSCSHSPPALWKVLILVLHRDAINLELLEQGGNPFLSMVNCPRLFPNCVAMWTLVTVLPFGTGP